MADSLPQSTATLRPHVPGEIPSHVARVDAIDRSDTKTESPSTTNDRRGVAALRAYQRAESIAGTPAVDFCSRVLKPLEVEQARRQAESLLEPGPIVEGAREAIPALGADELDETRQHMVDTLERPTTISVRASEQRLQLIEKLGILQMGADAVQTVGARNSIEKMLCHQFVASHVAAMNLMAMLQGLHETPSPFRSAPPPAEIARVANSAARLMESSVTVAQLLHRIQTGGTQRVIVQHQQVGVAKDGPAVLFNRGNGARAGGRARRGRNAKNRK